MAVETVGLNAEPPPGDQERSCRCPDRQPSATAEPGRPRSPRSGPSGWSNPTPRHPGDARGVPGRRRPAADPEALARRRWRRASTASCGRPAFLELMKHNLKAMTDLKVMQDQVVQDTARQFGLPLADDITGLFERLHSTEQTILDRLEAIEDRLKSDRGQAGGWDQHSTDRPTPIPATVRSRPYARLGVTQMTTRSQPRSRVADLGDPELQPAGQEGVRHRQFAGHRPRDRAGPGPGRGRRRHQLQHRRREPPRTSAGDPRHGPQGRVLRPRRGPGVGEVEAMCNEVKRDFEHHRHPRQQRGHQPRPDVQEADQGSLGRGDQHRPDQRLPGHQAVHRRHGRRGAGAG